MPQSKVEIYKKQLEWRKNNKKRFDYLSLKSKLKKKYGLTPEDYQKMITLCGNKCEICRISPEKINRQRRLSVDHNHQTGKIRGILCHSCNIIIGLCKENPEILKEIIKYLKK